MMAIKRFKSFFNPFQPTSIAPLVVFRIIFGGLMAFGSLRFLLKGWVNEMYVQPQFYFGYLGFEWVKPLPDYWMYLPFIFIFLASIGILLGAFYRWSSFLFFVSFTYIELLDKSNYLNHYYFINLIAFLLLFAPAHHFFSLDVKWKRVQEKKLIPQWPIGIIKFQLACVYIFAGIAKLEYDWLIQAQPLKIWIQAHRDMPLFGHLLTTEWVAYFFSWFGCLYDLFIVFFLLSTRFRAYAYVLVVIFHFVTWVLLPIGIFPWVMIFSTLLFFSVPFHQKLIHLLSRLLRYPIEKESTPERAISSNRGLFFLLLVFVFFQIIIPFRYLLSPGNLFWNEEGFRFSWRVMLMHKEGTAVFYVRDKKSGGEIEVPNCTYLTPTQIDQMSTQPDMVLQYAKFLQRKYSDTLLIYGDQKVHLLNPSIHAEVHVSLNGRPSQLFISKKHDLTQIPYNFAHRNWLEPFKE
jgi:hypothetical protein